MATLGAGHADREDQSTTTHLYAVDLERSPGAYERYLKQPLEVLLAVMTIAVLSPVILLLVAVVRIRLGSPVLYRQERVGRDGELFTIYKFRTMIPDRRQGAGGYRGPERRNSHKTPNDPRVVPLGRFLRKWSLDELPQLWNVIRGDMSLVGPRPELPEIVTSYEDWQHARHSVKPGITGLWQISGREELLKDCTGTDLEYIDTLSFVTDMRILLATPLAVFSRKPGF